MGKAAVIHIGTPKTGTTSIQDCLAAAQRKGELSPACYPLWRHHRHQLWLAPLYRPHDELPPRWHRTESMDSRRFQRMLREFRRSLFRQLGSASGAVISAEGLSLNTVQLVDENGAFGRLLGLRMALVVTAFGGPFQDFAFDHAGVGAQPACGVDSAMQ